MSFDGDSVTTGGDGRVTNGIGIGVTWPPLTCAPRGSTWLKATVLQTTPGAPSSVSATTKSPAIAPVENETVPLLAMSPVWTTTLRPIRTSESPITTYVSVWARTRDGQTTRTR